MVQVMICSITHQMGPDESYPESVRSILNFQLSCIGLLIKLLTCERRGEGEERAKNDHNSRLAIGWSLARAIKYPKQALHRIIKRKANYSIQPYDV